MESGTNLSFGPKLEAANIRYGTNNIFCTNFRIESKGKGSIAIGDYNLFDDNVTLVNNSDEDMIIGSFNHLRVGSSFLGGNIGSHNIFGVKSRFQGNLGDGCLVETNSNVIRDRESPLVDHSFVSNEGIYHRGQTDTRSQHVEHLQTLQETLPKYHNLHNL